MNVVWIVFLLAMGACVGRFLNWVIWRLPRGRRVVICGAIVPRTGGRRRRRIA